MIGKLIDNKINDLKKRKMDLETCVEILKKDADKISFEAGRKIDLTLLIKANSFGKPQLKKHHQLTYWIKQQ